MVRMSKVILKFELKCCDCTPRANYYIKSSIKFGGATPKFPDLKDICCQNEDLRICSTHSICGQIAFVSTFNI